MTAPMIPALLAASVAAAREKAVLDAFSVALADAPARAVPLAALPALDPDVFGRLLERGAVREGAPGTFYRYVSARPARQTPAAVTLGLVVLLVAGLALLVGMLLVRRTAR
jgi:hypothetical protein